MTDGPPSAQAGLNDQQIAIARFIALQAVNGVRTNYRELAMAISWSHPTGRGLGRHLRAVLEHTHAAGLPTLTSILCTTGASTPPAKALDHMRKVCGPFDLATEQARVFDFPWESVAELGFEASSPPDIDFDRLYATRTWGFSTDTWGMTGFRHQITRDKLLEAMDGRPIYVVYFCSPRSEAIEGHEGRFTIKPAYLGRVLGIVELQPQAAIHATHTAPSEVEEMIALWGEARWPHGLAISRAWAFAPSPKTEHVLPNARSTSWEATRGVVPLTEEEKAYVRQYRLREVPVYGRTLREVAFALREPMHTTYLAICDDPVILAKTHAPPGTKLVKIGVSGDTDRRLRDLNDHHFARIFGLSFRMYVTHRWPTQAQALLRESAALEWAAEHSAKPASGEYFYMTDAQVFAALPRVKPPKMGR